MVTHFKGDDDWGYLRDKVCLFASLKTRWSFVKGIIWKMTRAARRRERERPGTASGAQKYFYLFAPGWKYFRGHSGHSDSDNCVISRSPLLCNTACLLSRSNIPPSSKFKLNFVARLSSMISPGQNPLSQFSYIYIIRQMILFFHGRWKQLHIMSTFYSG